MQDKVPAAPIEYVQDIGGAPAASGDLFVILAGVLRRWKLIAAITLSAFFATYGVLKLVPPLYKSTVEILVYDPQGQIDASVQKPISPFVDAFNYEAMNTEIHVIKSKSVAVRVAGELGLDRDPEFQSHNLFADLAQWLGFPHLGRADNNNDRTTGGTARLDEAADALLGKLEVWPDSYVISISITSQSPIKAQRLASTIANDYLASQREARQQALQQVAAWLKGRVDDLQSRVLETESSIENLKAKSGIRDTEFSDSREQQISALINQLSGARAELDDKRARLEQARHVTESNGDVQSLTSSPFDFENLRELVPSSALAALRQKQAELSWRAADLQNKVGERHAGVIALRAELAGVNKEINAEVQHVLGNFKNAYDIAVRREQALEADLQRLTAGHNSEAYQKLQQLRHLADTDRNLYQSYLSQYNDISERRTLQDASARIISPATLPRSPTSSHRKLYALGGILGLGGGFLLAFLLEYLWSGVKTATEIEQSFGRPVVGMIPLMQYRKSRGVPFNRLLHRMVDEPLSHVSEAVHSMRISLELSSANPKVILITSAIPGEGKSTAAMLLAASSASSGKRTVLLDCDLRQRSTSEAFRNKDRPGLSELLRGTAELMDVITTGPGTKIYMIPAGSMVPNVADLLMSQPMRDLIAELRSEFDYIVMDTSPLLPVVDALALATVADKVLVIVEWDQTPRVSISEAFKVLGPEAHRVAGIVLNKVDLKQLQWYGYRGGYHYSAVGKYFSNRTFPFLFSVALVAVATIVLFSIVSISQLDASKATLRGSSIDNSLLDDKVIGTVVSYPDSNASPVSAQTKSPSSSNADNTPSSTPVPPLSGMRSEEIVAEPALMLTPDRKASATAIETGSTQGPSTVETAPSELSAPQEVSAQPASIADAASATAIETSHGSTQRPSTVETAPSELSAPQEVSAQPASIADAASATAIETSHGSTQRPSTVETAPSELSAPQEVSAQPASIADAASATAIETSHGSTQRPSTVETAPPELSAPQEVSAQPASIADAASAAQHAAGVTVPTLAISDEQHDQMFRDFEIQGNGHTTLDPGSAAERGFGATSSRGSPPLRHATSHRQDAAEADHKITQKLNRLELSRLLKGPRASR